MNKKPELLAPGGSLEKLKTAVIYGADAVYIGGEAYSLRAAAENFSAEDMRRGLDFAHERGKKVYLTANIIPHNKDIDNLKAFTDDLRGLEFDGILVADLGMFSLFREYMPDMPLHISTQANNVNYASARMWHRLGAKRVVLAREMSLDEIKEIRSKVPGDLELEAFVHGAMCISYSGRCLLSNYMTGRDSNMGQCAHPCRWNYSLTEQTRPGEYFDIYENERGSFIFNSKDLCTIAHIPELVKSGIDSFKIEGRVKTAYYTATVVKAYREEIDRYFEDPQNYAFDEKQLEELCKVSHRPYYTGFYLGRPDENAQVYASSSYIRDYDIIGVVREYDEKTKLAVITQKNRFFEGDEIEIMQPGKPFFKQTVRDMKNENGESITVAPHAAMTVIMPTDEPVTENAVIRKRINRAN
ncbi:MAG: U32 family peptidase [Oscillospiraceae bacterium]|nr:U32 family peptidase [Oscillospiraceae bacterium]